MVAGPLPIIPARFELKLLDEKGSGKQFAVIKRLLRAADEIVCATDAGREGELIFRYIQELAGATGKPARRLWLNSLTPAAIRDAFRRPRSLSDYDALYAAARCRSQADWIVGLNATRIYTVRHRDGGKERKIVVAPRKAASSQATDGFSASTTFMGTRQGSGSILRVGIDPDRKRTPCCSNAGAFPHWDADRCYRTRGCEPRETRWKS